MSQVGSENVSRAKLSKTSVSFPTLYWTTVTNADPGWTWIVVPAAGDLWVYCEASQMPAQFYVLHTGGKKTPINPGENNIPVVANDMIMYQILKPGSDEIKFAYQLKTVAPS